MTSWQAVLLGIVQGLTEFLPVSSSGHLVLAKAIFGIEEHGIAFEVFVHFGTLLSVVTAFRKDIWDIFKEATTLLVPRAKSKKEAPNPSGAEEGRPLIIILLFGTVPAAVLGFLYQDVFESFFASPRFVSGALIITGTILLITKFIKVHPQELDYPRSVFIGLAQVGAFFPGISRSGTTISTGLILGLKPVESARFSFLLAVPLIFGVTVIKVIELIAVPPSNQAILLLVLGSISAYVSGLLAIQWLMGVVRKGRLDRFAYYCFGVGFLGLLLLNI